MKVFKSLKAYKYFTHCLVTNMSLAELHGQDDLITMKHHCCSSLKAKTTYSAFLVLEKSGNVLAAKCNCVAGKGLHVVMCCPHVLSRRCNRARKF